MPTTANVSSWCPSAIPGVRTGERFVQIVNGLTLEVINEWKGSCLRSDSVMPASKKIPGIIVRITEIRNIRPDLYASDLTAFDGRARIEIYPGYFLRREQAINGGLLCHVDPRVDIGTTRFSCDQSR